MVVILEHHDENENIRGEAGKQYLTNVLYL